MFSAVLHQYGLLHYIRGNSVRRRSANCWSAQHYSCVANRDFATGGPAHQGTLQGITGTSQITLIKALANRVATEHTKNGTTNHGSIPAASLADG